MGLENHPEPSNGVGLKLLRPIVLLTVALVLATQAQAGDQTATALTLPELLPVSTNGDGDASFRLYIKTPTVRRLHNGMVQAWGVLDYKSAQYDTVGHFYYQSAIVLREYDCEQRAAGILSIVWYSDPLGQGRVLGNSSTPPDKVKRDYPPPHSVGDYDLTAVCGLAGAND